MLCRTCVITDFAGRAWREECSLQDLKAVVVSYPANKQAQIVCLAHCKIVARAWETGYNPCCKRTVIFYLTPILLQDCICTRVHTNICRDM